MSPKVKWNTVSVRMDEFDAIITEIDKLGRIVVKSSDTNLHYGPYFVLSFTRLDVFAVLVVCRLEWSAVSQWPSILALFSDI